MCKFPERAGLGIVGGSNEKNWVCRFFWIWRQRNGDGTYCKD